MEATIHAGSNVGEASGRHHLLRTKSVSIKLIQKPLGLHKSLAAPNSLYCSSRPLIARGHWGEFNAASKHGHRRFKFKFRAKEKAEQASYGKGRRTWWSDGGEGDEEEEEEEELGILEDFIDSLWILKVFKSYGWGLPFIIISWLLATGPKAFLMTLAIPLGQSAVTLAISRLWGKTKESRVKTKGRAEKRKKPSASPWAGRRRSDKNYTVEERNADGEDGSGKMGYESWADKYRDSFVQEKGNGKTQSPSNSFGGWEELDGLGSVPQKPERVPGKPSQPQPQPVPGMPRQPQLRPRRRVATANGNAKLTSGRLRESNGTPLLLRLLIAVFPFLASWTKMF